MIHPGCTEGRLDRKKKQGFAESHKVDRRSQLDLDPAYPNVPCFSDCYDVFYSHCCGSGCCDCR